MNLWRAHDLKRKTWSYCNMNMSGAHGGSRVGKVSFARRFPTHGRLYGRKSYLGRHGVEKGFQFFWKPVSKWNGFWKPESSTCWTPVSKLPIFWEQAYSIFWTPVSKFKTFWKPASNVFCRLQFPTLLSFVNLCPRNSAHRFPNGDGIGNWITNKVEGGFQMKSKSGTGVHM